LCSPTSASKDMITAILSGYKRGRYLDEQLEALNNQTVKPTEILLWYNRPEDGSEINHEIGSKIPVAYSNHNFGVWARFAFALNAKNPYVCIFDDDTIPGSKWFENCLETIRSYQGLLGTIGIVYIDPLPVGSLHCAYHSTQERWGWRRPNDEVKEVDFVGHAWFFKKEWLSAYWRELPDPKYNICGEDMHFSFMLQKYLGIKTYVPPHKHNDIQTWGSIKGEQYGGDSNALSITNQLALDGSPFYNLMDQYFLEQRRRGWRLVNDTNHFCRLWRKMRRGLANREEALTGKRVIRAIRREVATEFYNSRLLRSVGWLRQKPDNVLYQEGEKLGSQSK
jgi:hypothetical protein